MHLGDDLVEHRTHEVCFGAQCTNHSANSKLDTHGSVFLNMPREQLIKTLLILQRFHKKHNDVNYVTIFRMSTPEAAQICDGPGAEDASIIKLISDQDDVKQKTNGGSPSEPIYAVPLKRVNKQHTTKYPPIYAVPLKRVSKQHSTKNSPKSAQSFN